MSKNDKNSINILHLPEEVLEKILSYVPERLIVGQVCKTFYSISCRLGTFGLKIFRRGGLWDLNGEEIYKSILNSDRNIVSIRISICPTIQSSEDIDAMKKIIQRFGPSVKKFEIEHLKLSLADFSMLNLMPNLEQLKLRYIECENNEIDRNFDFDLFNLRKFSIYCSNDILLNFIIDRLPKDVLRVFEASHSGWSLPQNLSEKQSKLNKIEIFNDEGEQLQLSGLKELKELKLEWSDQEYLNHICVELKSLETLEILRTNKQLLYNFSILRDLPMLKRLVLRSDLDLTSIESSTLRVLSIISASLSTIRELSFKCPNLRELKLMDYKGEFNELFDLLPKLERFKCPAVTFEIPDGWKHHNLKHLELYGGYLSGINIEMLLPIVRSCKGLKTFSTLLKLSGDTMKQLLMENPNLKSLCIYCPTLEVAQAIKDHGEKLESLHVKHYELSTEVFKKLKEICPVVKQIVLDLDHFPISYLMMKKKGKVEKCCDGLEVDDA